MKDVKQMIRGQFVRAAVLALVAAAALLACGGEATEDEAIVADVGDRKIEMRQVTDYITALHVNYQTPQDELEARQRKLNQLIEEQLFIIGGYSKALDADIGIVELVDQEKDKFLLDELYRHEVIDKATFTDADVQKLYKHWFDRVTLRHIIVATKATADSLEDALKAGADFGDLAEEYSIDRSTGVRGGSFGREFRWTDLTEPMREPVFALKEGEISAPLEAEYGWHIVLMESRRQLEKQPLEQVRAVIERSLTRAKQETRRVEQLSSLRKTANIQLDSNGVEEFRAQVRATLDTVAGIPRSRRNIPVDSLPDTVKSMTLATYGTDGAVTVGQAAQQFNSIPWDSRTPELISDKQLSEMVFQVGLFDLLRAEALRLKMDEQPLYQERLQEYHEKLIADKMRDMVVSKNLQITDADMHAYYEANPDTFIDPISYRVREVMVNDSALAEKIVKMAREGRSMKDLAREYTRRTGFKSNGGEIGWVRPNRYPDLYEPASKLKVGEIGGPIPGTDQYSIIELLEVQPATQRTFDDVQQSLYSRMQNALTDSIVAAYKDSMSVLYPITIHEDVLRMGLGSGETASSSAQ
jgi:peptidyl-prolyl cis-trans isomerase C